LERDLLHNRRIVNYPISYQGENISLPKCNVLTFGLFWDRQQLLEYGAPRQIEGWDYFRCAERLNLAMATYQNLVQGSLTSTLISGYDVTLAGHEHIERVSIHEIPLESTVCISHRLTEMQLIQNLANLHANAP
jgi:hypothetical protein